MTMAEPGGVTAWATSASPVITSGMAKTRAGSGDQPSRAAAKSRNASARTPW
jgi:hypothetical protein